MEQKKQPQYSTRTQKKSPVKIYDESGLNDLADSNMNLLQMHFKLTKEEWKILDKNVYQIVDYIAAKKRIERIDHYRIGRLMRIVYSEYTDFLTDILSLEKIEAEDNLDMIVKRSLHPLVREFREEAKPKIFNKYLRKYESYERTFAMR